MIDQIKISGPREAKVPGSEPWCWQTVRLAKLRWSQVEDHHEQLKETLAEIKAHRVWEHIPAEHPYGSYEALLEAEFGASSDQVEARLTAARSLNSHGGDRRSDEFQGSNTTLIRSSRGGWLAKLERDAPKSEDVAVELAQVQRGNSTPHAAAVRLGWRTPPIQVPRDVDGAVRSLRKHFSAEDCLRIGTLLVGEA